MYLLFSEVSLLRVLYMQIVLIIRALYAKCLVAHMTVEGVSRGWQEPAACVGLARRERHWGGLD